MNKIFYIMGKSASGKDKIYKNLLCSEKLDLKNLVLYTTRPIRSGEVDGREYFFVGEDKLKEITKDGRLIESRAYNTIHGVWTYFTADDGQIDLEHYSYIGIGTLESFQKLVAYYGKDVMCPIYVQVEDGERLRRALKREGKQEDPKYAEMCRRFLADAEDFSEDKIKQAGIERRFENIDLEDCIKEIEKYIKDTKYPPENAITSGITMV